MSVVSTKASLRCFTTEPTASFVGLALECAPTSEHAVGEPLSATSPTGARRTESLWILESPLASSVSLDVHLEYLLAIIDRRAVAFDAVRRRLEHADVFCFVESESQGGLVIVPELLARLGARRLALTLDLYPASGA